MGRGGEDLQRMTMLWFYFSIINSSPTWSAVRRFNTDQRPGQAPSWDLAWLFLRVFPDAENPQEVAQ